MVNEILPLWENPEIQEINRLPMSSPLLPFASAEEALRDAIAGPEYCRPGKNPLYLSLDSPGVWDAAGANTATSPWRFKLVSNPREDLPPSGDCLIIGGKREKTADLSGWTNPGFDASSWHSIVVPGTWSRQGGDERFENTFDKPHYTNVQMPFQAVPPHVPNDNPTGLYRRTFALPAAWKTSRVVFHLGSAESVAYIYINGFFAGAGKDTRLPQEYDITPFVKDGENLVCIKVVRYSDASYVEDQDQWWLGGIHRTVYLYATGVTYIKDIKALPGQIVLDGFTGTEKGLGRIKLALTLGGKLPESRSTGNGEIRSREDDSPFVVKYSLYPFSLPSSEEDAEKKAAELVRGGGLVSGSVELFADYRLNSNIAETDLVLEYPDVWSHEAPNLYLISVELYLDGKLIQCAAFCTGFRSVKVARRELLINDRMVYIKGANRHEHDEKTGKTLSVAAMVRDIQILKSHNFNAVRTSHYPDDERWYDLCDRYGIYLWDEANIESHCFYNQLCSETTWSYAFMIRMQRMVERDKNHPSVLVWSLGNESGYGPSHDAGAAWIRFYDPSRPVHYEGAMRGGKPNVIDGWERGKTVTDIVCPMYPVIENIIKYARYRDDHRPLIMCEFSHAMGNSNGSLADYWKAIESHHGLQGGFIWEWRDHGFEAYTEDGIKYWKYGGDFGDKPSDYDFVCDGLLFPDQGLKPVMAECRQVFAPVRLTPVPGKPLSFTLENRYDFSTLDHLAFQYKIFEDAITCGGGETKILKQGTIDLPLLKPGEKSETSFASENDFLFPSFGGTICFYGEFVLKDDVPWAKKGHIVAKAEKILKEAREPVCVSFYVSPNEKANTEKAGKEKPIQDLAALFKPSLYRVATQNDGLKTFIMLKGDSSASFYYKNKPMFKWMDLDLLHIRVTEEKKENILWEDSPAERYTATLLAGKNAADEYKRYAAAPGMGTYTFTVAKNDYGQPLVLEAVFDLDQNLPELPRVGIMAEISATYNEVSWFGLGPEESYPDRLAGVFLGRYKHSIADLEVPYVVPQENGNRSGVRNFTLLSSDASKNHITIRADKPISFSISRYSLENMWNACHTYELNDLSHGPDGRYFLYIDICQRGVGTATCGPDTREEYRIRPGLFKLKLYIS